MADPACCWWRCRRQKITSASAALPPSSQKQRAHYFCYDPEGEFTRCRWQHNNPGAVGCPLLGWPVICAICRDGAVPLEPYPGQHRSHGLTLRVASSSAYWYPDRPWSGISWTDLADHFRPMTICSLMQRYYPKQPGGDRGQTSHQRHPDQPKMRLAGPSFHQAENRAQDCRQSAVSHSSNGTQGRIVASNGRTKRCGCKRLLQR